MKAESGNVAPTLRVGKLRHAERGGNFDRTGLSLLEVMLAIAILGLALATMGELVRIGTQAAGEARDLTKAQILCEGLMSEVAAGVIPLESAEETPLELDPEWTYSVTVGPIDEGGLLGVTMMVQKVVEDSERPVYFTLTRWMIDPLLEQVVDSETILGGESEPTTGTTGDGANQDNGQGANGQNQGDQGGQGGAGGQVGGGGANGNNPGGRGNQGGRGDQGDGGQGGGRQGGGGQFGGGRQGGGGQSDGGRQGGGQRSQGRSGGMRGR
jgi:prepilin-type N-terminal cleavage/methylation domain-containing protein